MTAPVLQLPVKVLRSATAGRRPGDGTFRALTDGEVFINTQDRVLCYLNASGTLLTVPFDPAYFAGLAPLASPALTGTPTAPTPSANDNSTKVATTAYADRAAGSAAPVQSVAGRTGAVTLGVADVSGAAPLASPALTGSPTAPTQTALDKSTKLATTAYADAADAAMIGTSAPLMDGAAAAGTSGKTADAAHRHPTDTSRAASGNNADITQLSGLTAAGIKALLSSLGFAVSATTSGYLKIPTGSGTVLILQWGQASVSSSGAASVSFPVAFPNGILGRPVCTPEGSSTSIVLGVQTSSITASGFQGNMTYASGGSTGACNGNSFDWWALGY